MFNEYPFQVDIMHPLSWVQDVSEADHIKYVDKFVNDLINEGFNARVETYDGPGGGAAVVSMGIGTSTFEALDEYMSRVYGEWDPEA